MTLDQLIASKLRPGLCLIRPQQTARLSDLLEMPDNYDTRQPVGDVVNAGTSLGKRTLEIADGDRVIYDRVSANEFKVGDDVLNLVRHEDVMCVVTAD